MAQRTLFALCAALIICATIAGVIPSPAFSRTHESTQTSYQVPSAEDGATTAGETAATEVAAESGQTDYWPLLFVFALATFIGLGVIIRVSRLLHTPLMSLTNAISAIAVVGSIMVTGSDYPQPIRIMGAIALFASMTNIVSGFLITDRMLKMFKTEPKGASKR
jgi:proton-translocating NAD(P)+ transhydrogenase subunit alpha